MSVALHPGRSALPALAALALSAGGLEGQECGRTEDPPGHAVSLDAYVDSAAVSALVAESWPAIDGFAFAHLLYDETSLFAGAYVYGESVDDREAERLAEAIDSLARPDVMSGEGIDMLLGSASGPAVRAVAGFARCPPALRNQTYIMQSSSRPPSI